MMRKKMLGSTGISVSYLGLGTVKFGRNQGVKYPESFVLPSDREIVELLALARDLQINLLDTAPAYGTSEERLGKLLKGQRQEWVISTKVGEVFSNDQSFFDFSKKAIQQSVDDSLKKLNTDFIDIVLVHSSGEDEKIIQEQEVFITLEKLKTAGKIRAFGMSTKTLKGGLLAVELSDVVMVTYNTDHQEEGRVISFAHEQQKGILIKKAFGSGHIKTISEALNFISQKEGVSSIVVGTLNPRHLEYNAQCVMLPF